MFAALGDAFTFVCGDTAYPGGARSGLARGPRFVDLAFKSNGDVAVSLYAV